MNIFAASALVALLLLAGCASHEASPGANVGFTGRGAGSAVVRNEFIFDDAPFPSAHASTIAETTGGDLLAAWFGGKEEGAPDVGIWLSRFEGDKWSPPLEVAAGVQADGKQLPCWNPVLFQSHQGPLFLFYKVGPTPKSWWGLFKTSKDGGRTWSNARPLPDRILGPIKNKPVQLKDGTIVAGSSTENSGWKVHMESTSDGGLTWQHTKTLNDVQEFDVIQPTILVHGGGNLQILCRSKQ
ncbi:MAG TPA: sialidase family protein, partial [Verrucomicrobiae bacterium]|nr:sialidase family protein [Verrucomicrobiae bacterium]